MEYRIIRTGEEPDSFEHALFGGGRQKGAQNKNHKYLARAWWKNKWRYAYTEAEVRALQMLGKAKQTAKEAGEKVSSTAKKASDIATGKYANAVDNKASTAKQNIARATEARNQEQQKAAAATARKESADNKLFKTKKTQQTSANASASAERASANAKKYDEARSKAQADLASAARERETTAYKVSKAVNDTTAKAKSAANKVADTVKDTAKTSKEIVSDISDAVKEKAKDAAETWKDDGPRKVADAARDVSEQIGKSVKKAADAATGKYSKDVDARLSKANENYSRASEDLEKQRQMRDAAWKRRSSDNDNADAAYERASKNAREAERKAVESKFEQIAAKKEQESTAYKVSKAVNDTSNKIKSTADKGKAKAEELFGKASNAAKSAAKKVEIPEQRIEEVKIPEQRIEEVKIPEKKIEETKIPEKFVSDAKTVADKGKSKVEELFGKASTAAKSTAAKAYDKVTDGIEKVRESDAMAYANKAAEKVKDKVSDTAERVADKVTDATANARHIADANKAKAKYGTDSLQYKEAKAHVDYDKAIDELAKARKKYGVDSTQYKQAAAAESKARETWQDAREQNLYKNNKEYRTYSDRASYLGSYLDNWDAKGGPQTTEGKANYQKMLRELNALENKLDNLRR